MTAYHYSFGNIADKNKNPMSKRDFFRVIIKMFGLYWIISSLLSVIPGNISYALSNLGYLGYLWAFGTAAIIILLFIFLIRKTDSVIDLLKLDKGFDDETIQFEKFNDVNIIKLSSIIIGGILLIENIPGFLSHTLFAFDYNISGHNRGAEDNFYWAVTAINCLVGFLLLTNYSDIANILKNKKNDAV